MNIDSLRVIADVKTFRMYSQSMFELSNERTYIFWFRSKFGKFFFFICLANDIWQKIAGWWKIFFQFRIKVFLLQIESQTFRLFPASKRRKLFANAVASIIITPIAARGGKTRAEVIVKGWFLILARRVLLPQFNASIRKKGREKASASRSSIDPSLVRTLHTPVPFGGFFLVEE